jgi:transposase-like protein
MSTNTTRQKGEEKKTRRVFAAREKCEAVLSVWSERRKPAEVCRELEIPWQMLNNWQDAAIKGMMQALEPRRTPDGQRLPLLSPRVEKLLEKADVVVSRRSRAEARLASIQKAVEAKKSGSAAGSPKG